MAVALSKAQREANDRYIEKNYTQVKLSMPNAEADALKEYCEARGCKRAGFIREAIKEKMAREPIVRKSEGNQSENE